MAALQSATDRSVEVAEAAARDRDEARVAAATAAQRVQQEREGLAEMEGENEGLRARLQMAEEELGGLVADADKVRTVTCFLRLNTTPLEVRRSACCPSPLVRKNMVFRLLCSTWLWCVCVCTDCTGLYIRQFNNEELQVKILFEEAVEFFPSPLSPPRRPTTNNKQRRQQQQRTK